MANNTILITGGTGFAGSHLVEYLLGQGEQHIHVTSMNADKTFIHDLLPADHIHAVDLTNGHQTAELIQQLQPTQIYHLAALSEVGLSFDQAEKTITNNTLLQFNILESVRLHAPAARILIIGSAQEYDLLQLPTNGDIPKVNENHPLGPSNPYAVSKVTQDLMGLSYFYSYQLNVVRARPFNHTGPRQSPLFAIPAFAQQIAKVEAGQQTEISVGNLDAIRDFTDVRDMISAYHVLITKGEAGQVYNIGSGQGQTMQTVLDQLIALSTTAITVVADPTKMRPSDIPAVVADISKIQSLGWQPKIALTETLQSVLEYWRTQV